MTSSLATYGDQTIAIHLGTLPGLRSVEIVVISEWLCPEMAKDMYYDY